MPSYTEREIVVRTYDWHCTDHGGGVPHAEVAKAMHAAARSYRAHYGVNDNTELTDDALWVYGDDTGVGVRFDVDETQADRNRAQAYREVCGERDDLVRELATVRLQADINRKNLQEWEHFAGLQQNRLRTALLADTTDGWEALIELVEEMRQSRDRLRTERDDLRRQVSGLTEKNANLHNHYGRWGSPGPHPHLLPQSEDDEAARLAERDAQRAEADARREAQEEIEEHEGRYGPYGSSPIDVIDEVGGDEDE